MNEETTQTSVSNEEEGEPYGYNGPEGFPWVSRSAFVEHYTDSLSAYLENAHSDKWGDAHVTDISSSALAFAEVWWHIFEDIGSYYKYKK